MNYVHFSKNAESLKRSHSKAFMSILDNNSVILSSSVNSVNTLTHFLCIRMGKREV